MGAEAAADAVEAAEAADTGQLSSRGGNRIPVTGPVPGAGPGAPSRAPTGKHTRWALPRTGARIAGGVCALVEQLSCGAP
ncbi:hypothetical protein GCM10022384_17750 [Streptomyces marokkonensis]|uniref:Uncharacterized protein n=1 Tax=Streptomyces marokkonensis TaxID=324855 RepID=A0ABP7PJH6_9ACTN